MFSIRFRVRVRFSVRSVSGYAHVFVLPSVVIVTLPVIMAGCDVKRCSRLVSVINLD